MRKFRHKSLDYFYARPIPQWGGNLNDIDFDNIFYYIKPTENQAKSWEDLPADILDTWDKLGIPEAEKKYLAGVGAQYESEVVYHKLQEDLEKKGVIFLDTDTALREHEDLFKQYFGTIIPQNDNKFAALNSAVWSGGSFIYVPPGVHIEMPLQAYFRINAENMGQFERTLILVDEGAYVHYVEGCTAPIYSTDSLHSAVVEIVVKKGGRCRYTTIQNWSNNVYNLVTKRAVAYEDATMEWVDGNLGSKLTMKYPAIWLMGERAHGEVLSIAFAGAGQHQDAGGKCVHVAPNTTSVITSKSISKNGGRAGYRGLLQVDKSAHGSKSKVVCDALILDDESRSDTYPYIKIDADDVDLGHEATVSKIGEEQLFYLMSRGMTESEASAMIVSGFVEPITKELPLEYAVEMNRLIQLQMEGLGRLMDVEHVDFVSVPVTDMERSIAVVPRHARAAADRARARFPEFKLGDNVFLYLIDPKQIESEFRRRTRRPIALRVADVARDEGRARGGASSSTARSSTRPSATWRSFADPDGNRFVLHRRYAPCANDRARPTSSRSRCRTASAPRSFYGETLGLTKNPNSTENWWEYETGNVTLAFVDPRRRSGGTFTPLPIASIVLRVADLDAARESSRQPASRSCGESDRLRRLPMASVRRHRGQRPHAPPPLRGVSRRDDAVISKVDTIGIPSDRLGALARVLRRDARPASGPERAAPSSGSATRASRSGCRRQFGEEFVPQHNVDRAPPRGRRRGRARRARGEGCRVRRARRSRRRVCHMATFFDPRRQPAYSPQEVRAVCLRSRPSTTSASRWTTSRRRSTSTARCSGSARTDSSTTTGSSTRPARSRSR